MSKQQTVVVLGGGGVTGIAWEIGVLLGLAQAGFDVGKEADVLIGTSAGAFAGLAAVSGTLEVRYQEQLQDGGTEVPAVLSEEVREAYARVLTSNGTDPTAIGRAFGEIAAGAETISPEERAAVVRARLGTDRWPSGDFRVTAIDADTGDLVVIDKSFGLTLEQAACATGAVPGVWPAVEAGGRRWIDGGMVSTVNAHLAEGYDRVLILAPVPASMIGPSVDEVVDRLRSDGAQVVSVTPDAGAQTAIGPNPFDPSRRGPAAIAGEMQGRLLGSAVADALR